MNSLEFIEKQIKQEQGIIKTYEECFKIDKTEFDKSITRSYIQIHQKNINHLQQIKSELEAWEIVKRILDLTVKEDKQKYDFIYYWLIYHPYELLVIEKQDYEILKKALEVEKN